jgi:hypothetical protein
MTIYTVERALLDIAAGPQYAAQYAADPATFLSAYPLDPDEVRMILDLDVREMTRRGLNPMLAMRAFSALQGRERLPDYLLRMKGS